MATKPSNNSLNVFKKPLALFSQQPMTGFYRDGYCRVGEEDGGNHAVAGNSTLLYIYIFFSDLVGVCMCEI